jgi:hypothetical protein
LYGEYLTKEAPGGFGDFKTGGQIIRTMKCADELELLATEDVVLQGMIGRLTEIGRCYGMEMNEEQNKVVRISRQPSPIQIMIEQKQQENVECFRYLDSMLTDDTICTPEIKSRIVVAKPAFKKTFHQQIGFKFKEETS